MKNNNAKLTAGSVSLTLAGMSIGMFFGHLAMTVFNLTDTYFVAKLGTTNLAAMSFTFPIVAILLGVVFGIGIGASSVISYAIGKGRYKQVKILSTDALFLTFFLCSIFSLLGIVFMDEIFSVLGAGGATLMYVKKYMLIWFAVFPFSAIPMVGNNIIRATGNAKIPGMIMSFSAIINLIVDPILIFGMFGFPAMGISGAAISTVLARTIAMCITLYYLNIKLKFIDLSGLGISRFYRSWKKILHIGLPSALTQIFIPISAAIVTRIIAEFGDNAIAAAGAGMKIDMFALITVFALASAVLPFAGQNYGALKLNRIDRSYTISNIFSVGWGILCFLIMYIFAHPIAEIFTNDSSVALYLEHYLKILPIGYGAIGVCIISSQHLNGIHLPGKSMYLYFIRTFILTVPLCYFGSILNGVYGVFWGILFANIIAAVLAVFIWRKAFNKLSDLVLNKPFSVL